MSGRVRVLPAGVEFDVGDGESVFHAARRNGVRWPSICNGELECGMCYMLVRDGAERLSAKSRAESDRLGQGLQAGEPSARLACQSYLDGPVTVLRKGVRPIR